MDNIEDESKSLQELQNEVILKLEAKILDLESKLEMTYDLALNATTKVRIGSGYWYMHSPIIIAALIATVFGTLIICLKQSGINIDFTSSLIWPIPIVIFALGAIFNTSNKQYSDYQEGKDAMLLVKMTELFNKQLAESKAQFEKDFANREKEFDQKMQDEKALREKHEQEATKAREKYEMEATKAREKYELEATKTREKHEQEANARIIKQNEILDAMLAKINKLDKEN